MSCHWLVPLYDRQSAEWWMGTVKERLNETAEIQREKYTEEEEEEEEEEEGERGGT